MRPPLRLVAIGGRHPHGGKPTKTETLRATSASTSADRLDRFSAEFSKLDQAEAVDCIRILADIGLAELEIVTVTTWSIGDVCRALGGRL